MLKQISTSGSSTTHTAVGQFSGMATLRSGRIYEKTMFEIMRAYDVTHNTLGRRRTAYISEAQK